MLSNLVKGVISGVCVFSLGTAVAHSDVQSSSYDFVDNLVPFAGIDGFYAHQGYKSGFGDNLFKKNFPGMNFYAGTKFHPNFGLSVGYETSFKRTRDTRLVTGDVYLGTTIALPTVYVDNSSTSKIKGWHFNLIGFYDVPVEDYKFTLFGSIGGSFKKAELNRVTTATDLGPLVPPNSIKLDKGDDKFLVRLRGGVSYLFTPNFGARVFVGWENTSKLKPSNVTGASVSEAKLKDTFSYGLGLLITA